MAVLDWDPQPYPDPRKNRRGIAKSGDPSETPEVIVPVVYPWAFNLFSATGTHRVWESTRVLKGPALVKSMTLVYQSSSAAGQSAPVISLRWAESLASDQAIVTQATHPGGTEIISSEVIRTDTIADPKLGGWMPLTVITSHQPITFPLNFPINVPEFKILASMDVPSNASNEASGLVLIYEQIDPRYVGRFMN